MKYSSDLLDKVSSIYEEQIKDLQTKNTFLNAEHQALKEKMANQSNSKSNPCEGGTEILEYKLKITNLEYEIDHLTVLTTKKEEELLRKIKENQEEITILKVSLANSQYDLELANIRQNKLLKKVKIILGKAEKDNQLKTKK